MSLPPMKALDSTSQIPHEDSNGQDASSAANQGGSVQDSQSHQKNNSMNSAQLGGNSLVGGQASASTATGQQVDDPYRYSAHQQAPSQSQQYPYYNYQPMYTQQFQNYPYYQSSVQAGSNPSQATQLNSAYPDYSNYSRANYQGYGGVPVYQNQVMSNTAAAGGASATGNSGSVSNGATPVAGQTGSVPPQPNPATATSAATASGIGQVQPVGSRPRVTTTMWEDEKTLCYQVEANGVSVVRRADNNMINGTKLLNVAHMTRGRRDGILKSEKVRDVVKIGSMHLKGVWIPFERALAMAQKEGIVDLLYPLFVRDIKQVIQQGSTTQPQANPAQNWYQQAQPQINLPQPSSAQSISTSQPNSVNTQPSQSTQATQANTATGKVSPYMTPTSISNSSIVDQKPAVTQSNQLAPQAQQPVQQQPQQQQPQQQQQGYYGYPYYPQYQYAYGTAGSTTAGATPAAGTTAVQGGQTQSSYQYPQQYNYGYMPQYQNQHYEEPKDK